MAAKGPNLKELLAFVRGFDTFVASSAIFFLAVIAFIIFEVRRAMGLEGTQAFVLVWEILLLFAVAYAGFVLSWKRSRAR